ncbi:MAG: Ig-like domain-containing protein [Sediminibacterium sp.]
MKRSSTHLLILVCLIVRIVTLSSCANIIPPGGGPRDSLPPRLISAAPRDSAVNVATKNIILSFDEYITLQNPTDLIVSPAPSPQGLPVIDYKLRNVIVKLKELDSNTTYSLNFGDIIRDVNEGNIAKNFIYAFSTGKTIDYNTYSGKLLLAETGKPQADSSLLIVLHRNLDDTAVKKSYPRYYAKLNGRGEFIFHNLPKGNFAVYAVDNRFTKKYDDSTQFFAFRSTPVIIGTNTPIDTLYAYQEVKRASGNTTVNNTSARPAGINKEVDKRLKYGVDLDNGQQDILNNMTLVFNRKLTNFDSTKFILYDTSFNKLNGSSFSLDSGKTKVIVKYKWKEGAPYRLLIAKDAVSDSAAITLTKADTLRFFAKKETEYGSIRLRFANLDLSKNPVLQIVQNDKVVDSAVLLQPDFQRKLYKPGTYDVRILFDTNKNGVWDPGKFFGAKRQPEIVYLVPKQIAIRANWDNEVTITL